MLLEEYQFGKADAATEYLMTPEIFEKAFFDSRNIAEKLIKSYEFMLIGRKGVGKSAFSARIMSIADNSSSAIAEQINLDDFNFEVFEKTSVSENIEGTRKYKEVWDFVLLLQMYNLIYNNLKITEIRQISKVVDLLETTGFNIEKEINNNISFLTKLKLSFKYKGAEVSTDTEVQKNSNDNIDYSMKINDLTQKMLEALKAVYLENGKLLILIDGLDDILRFHKNQVEILSSLIRSTEALNKIFIKNKMPFKIILFIREDIMSMITDPDFNKIKRDGGITLSWYNRSDDLMDIVKLRLKLSGVQEEKLDKWWYQVFPIKINKKDSWNFILDHTLGKPRDILQFMITCTKLYPYNRTLTHSEIKMCIKEYSTNYFLDEMKNELAGFIDDDIIHALPSTLRKIGNREFSFEEFSRVQKEEMFTESPLSQEEAKHLLMLLFEAGYIGQRIPIFTYINGKKRKTKNVIFKYRNPTAVIDYREGFIIHRGLFKAMDIRE